MNHGSARDAPELTHAGLALGAPVVDGRTAIAGGGAQRRAIGRSLGGHHRARLDGEDEAVARLVRSGAGADVDDGAGVASATDMRAASRGSSRRVCA